MINASQTQERLRDSVASKYEKDPQQQVARNCGKAGVKRKAHGLLSNCG